MFRRLDPYVYNAIHPVIVLDNVPWAFAKSNPTDLGVTAAIVGGNGGGSGGIGGGGDGGGGRLQTATYGNNMGPENVTEYGIFIRTLLQGIVERYTLPVVETFWFRGTYCTVCIIGNTNARYQCR